jgi:hypothetical protein
MASNAPLSPQARPISIGKAIGLSIVTIGIYFIILVYRNAHDIHEGRPGALGAWKLLFWLGFVTFGITWIVLAVFNWIEVKAARERAGITDNTMLILALVFYFVMSIVGAILWAVSWNDTLARARTAAPASGKAPRAPRAAST